METPNESEWQTKLQQLKESSQRELVVKRNFGRDGQNILADMAQQLGLHLYALSSLFFPLYIAVSSVCSVNCTSLCTYFSLLLNIGCYANLLLRLGNTA